MDPKEKQKLMVLFGIFGIAGLMAYFNLLLAPQFSGFIRNNREFHTVRARVNSAKVLIASEDRIRKQFEGLKEQSGLLEERFPAQDEVSSLLGDFSGIAESSGVKILKIKPLEVAGDVSASELYSEFPILIEARAGYHQCGTFINKLENMERFIRIDEVDIKGRPDDPRRHDILLRVSTFLTEQRSE